MSMKKSHGKIAKVGLALTLALGLFSQSAFAAAPATQATQPAKTAYAIVNPYESVDWAAYGQYKADFHAHSTNSDGANLMKDMVEDHYAKGFDILAMTDHNHTTVAWDIPGYGRNVPGGSDLSVSGSLLTSARVAEIFAGAGRGGKGMISLLNTNEQSNVDHINTFWADFNNTGSDNMASIIAKAQELGGISHINHPGRYTGGANGNDAASIAASNNPANVQKYVDLFKTYPSLVGMEIINKIDNESKSDRILWDNILKEMMPQGRFVWGFSNDDSHALDSTGYAWNVMLMPELTEEATRTAMETGAFYAVSRVSRLDGINRYYPGTTTEVAGAGDASTLYLLEQKTPSISNIVVNGSIITITGADYNSIEWIADGVVVATGNSIDVSECAGINSYVRAQLKSATGIAFTQPFGVVETTCENVKVDASVKQLNGNKNDLTITVTETYVGFFGGQEIVSVVETVKTFSINNNAAGTYEVGEYKVYVDTKGNTQIRECYIVK